jgi:putative sterol carrier protein
MSNKTTTKPPVTISDLMTDLQTLLDVLKIVSEIKKPIILVVGDKPYSIDFEQKKVIQGKVKSPEIEITIAEKDFFDLQQGKINPMQAFMGGKIKVKGSMTNLMKFQTIQPKLEKLRSKY